MSSRSRVFVILLAAVVLAGLLATALRAPLSGVHGDSPIYVYHGKRYADTHLIADYARSARAIAANAGKATLGDAEFWSPYWHFTRLGHLVLVGSIVSAFGEGIDSIVALQWVFAALIAVAVLLAVANAGALASTLGLSLTTEKIIAGAVVSTALFMLSDIFGYLGRSIVSETPAVVALASATLSFAAGQQRRSWGWSIASGLLAFVLHIVRSEAIWPFVVFLVVLAASQRLLRLTAWLPGYAASLATAGLCWLGWLVWMYPLSDPRLFLVLAKLSDIDPDEASLHRLTASIGLLTIGVVLAFVIRGQKRAWVFPLAWSALALLPTVPHLVEGRSVQTRMFVPYLMLPAFVASTWGWAKLFSIAGALRRSVAIALTALASALLLVIGVPAIYERVRAQPGFWRVQAMNAAIGGWLKLPTWEIHDYDPREMRAAARAIAQDGRPGPVIAGSGVPYGNLYLARYFMERYPPSARLVLHGEPVAPRATCPPKPEEGELHSYCTGVTAADLAYAVTRAGGAYLMQSAAKEAGDTVLDEQLRKMAVYSGEGVRIWYVEPQGGMH